jgi:ribonuclease HI
MIFDTYTDGSCWNSCPFKVGTWAYVVVSPENPDELLHYEAKLEEQATSSTMEMLAVLNALEWLERITSDIDDERLVFRIHSDSAYVVNCFLERWYDLWEASTYIGVANEHIWRPLIGKVKELRKRGIGVQFVKVKGHAGDKFNELVDDLAGELRKNRISILKGENESKRKDKAEQRAQSMLWDIGDRSER